MIHGFIKAEFTTLKSGQVCRSPLAHALDEDGVQRLLNVHSMIQTLEAWILKKKAVFKRSNYQLCTSPYLGRVDNEMPEGETESLLPSLDHDLPGRPRAQDRGCGRVHYTRVERAFTT